MKVFEFKFNQFDIEIKKESVIVLGAFCSFHRGHQKLFRKAKEKALAEDKNLIVMLYDDYNALKNDFDKNILPLKTRIELLKQYSVDYLMIFQANFENYQLSIEKFLQFLREKLSVKDVFIGENFTFKKNNIDDFFLLKKYFNLHVIKLLRHNNRIISTTLLKELLNEKALSDFKVLSGFNYFYQGTVIPGKLLGSRYKTPTANVAVEKSLFHPPYGIYASLISFDRKKYYSVTSISNNPTFNEKKISFETHILQFNNNIYGKKVTVELLYFIRSPIKFKKIKALYEEIEKDKEKTRIFFKLD